MLPVFNGRKVFSVPNEMRSALFSVYVGPPSQVTMPAHLVPVGTQACSAYRIACVSRVKLASLLDHPDEECFLVTMTGRAQLLFSLAELENAFLGPFLYSGLKNIIKEKIPLGLLNNDICLQSSGDQKQILKGGCTEKQKILRAV